MTQGLIDPGSRIASFFEPKYTDQFKRGLWKNCPLLGAKFDPALGFLLDEQFNSYNAQATTGDYALTQATAGSAAISSTHPGTLAIDAGSATAAQGANVQRTKSAFVPASGKSLWAEFRVRMATSIVAELFIGLAAIDTSIIAGSALTTNNRIGFQSVSDDGVLLFAADKAGSTSTGQAAATVTLTDWFKLGFFYDGETDTIQQYVNGLPKGDLIATANVPKVALYPSFVCQAGGSGQPVLNVGGYRVFQLR